MRENRRTIFCDIDGTLFFHKDTLHEMISTPPCVLRGVHQRFAEWRSKDYYIVLTTARPEGCRAVTEDQLKSVGIFWDQLVMGLPVGPRAVINDTKPNGMMTAIAINVKRNGGLLEVEV